MKFRTFVVAKYIALACGLAPVLLQGATVPVPSEYQDLYDLLNTQISTFDNTVKQSWDQSKSQAIFSTQLLTAESNNYTTLLGPTYFQYSVLPELQEIQALGTKAVTVHINFPLLSAGFHQHSGTSMQDFVNFYQQVAQEVHARGMKLIVESSMGAEFPGNDLASTMSYVQSLSWDAYRQGRAETAVNIAQLIRPDYLSVMGEPDSEAEESGQTNVFTPSGATELVGQIVQSVRDSNASGVKIGAGCGTWIFPFSDWISVCTSLPGLDFADMHIYPTNRTYLTNALAFADAASLIGRPIAVSEAWAYKVRDNELGQVSYVDLYARDAFSFWSPIDIQFATALVNFSHAKRAVFASIPWPRYLFSYINYEQYSGAAAAAVMSASQSATAAALTSAQFTDTGLAWLSLVVDSPDHNAPLPPAAPVATVGTNVVGLAWPATTDNVGVAGYRVYRDGSLMATAVQPLWADQGLSSGVEHTYQIEAFDATGNTSALSTTVTAQTLDNIPPSVPTGTLVSEAAPGSASLRWQPSTDNVGVVGYRIFRGTSPATLLGVANVPCCSYVDAVAAATTYYYAVASYDAAGWTSAQSAQVKAVTPADTTPPSVPASLTGQAISSTQANLTWSVSTDNTRVANYRVFRGRTPTALQQVGASTSTFFSDTRTSGNITYYYAVSAVDIYGNVSAQSPAIAVTTPQ